MWVYIPYEHSVSQNVILVGQAGGNGLPEARTYILEIVERYKAMQAKDAPAHTSTTVAPSATESASASDAPTPIEEGEVTDSPVVEERSASAYEGSSEGALDGAKD